MSVGQKYTALEATRILNAFVLFREEGIKAVEDTYPEYKGFVAQHKDWSVRQVKNALFPSSKSRSTKG